MYSCFPSQSACGILWRHSSVAVAFSTATSQEGQCLAEIDGGDRTLELDSRLNSAAACRSRSHCITTLAAVADRFGNRGDHPDLQTRRSPRSRNYDAGPGARHPVFRKPNLQNLLLEESICSHRLGVDLVLHNSGVPAHATPREFQGLLATFLDTKLAPARLQKRTLAQSGSINEHPGRGSKIGSLSLLIGRQPRNFIWLQKQPSTSRIPFHQVPLLKVSEVAGYR
mmetsp:Transcript_75913/g.180433  ORF Transcript_75913/g.180433 Transcript_75913/m.180433 type:complete len:226 (+) Transcript_75913:2245-2922(+)